MMFGDISHKSLVQSAWVVLGVWLVCVTAAAAQLPPDVMVDKYLLQAQIPGEEKNHKGVLEAMDRVVALQKEQDLTLPESLPFHYAQTALAAGSVKAAIESVNSYLTATGREGKHYRETLELLVTAERRLQEPAADQFGATPAKPHIKPQPQALPPSSTQSQKTAKAQPVADCKKWNTKKFFQKATVEDVTACINAGADPMARGRYNEPPLHLAAKSNNNAEVVKVLLKAGADPMARDQDNETPLHEAARAREMRVGRPDNNEEMFKALIHAGADPMARD